MRQLEALAHYAAHQRIRGRSYKRNSLLKPLAIIFDELERCPDPNNPDEVALAKASSKGMISDHIKRIAHGVHEEAIYEYVDQFFKYVLIEAHHNNVNHLLQRERSLRSAYLVYMREELAKIFVKRGQATTIMDALEIAEGGVETDEQNNDEDETSSQE